MTKQTTVRLPEELADQAEAVARVKGTSVNALIVESLAAEIERRLRRRDAVVLHAVPHRQRRRAIEVLGPQRGGRPPHRVPQVVDDAALERIRRQPGTARLVGNGLGIDRHDVGHACQCGIRG